jgi:hypothetical protein
MGKDLEGSIGHLIDLLFQRSDEGIPRKAHVIIASFPTKIRTEYVPNMGVEGYRYVNPLAEDNIEMDLEAKWRSESSGRMKGQ